MSPNRPDSRLSYLKYLPTSGGQTQNQEASVQWTFRLERSQLDKCRALWGEPDQAVCQGLQLHMCSSYTHMPFHTSCRGVEVVMVFSELVMASKRELAAPSFLTTKTSSSLGSHGIEFAKEATPHGRLITCPL